MIPIDAYVQFAGGQGLLSFGIAATPLKRISVSFGVGYTPPAYGGILTFTGKCLYTPWSIHLNERMTLLPLSVGLHATLTHSKNIDLGWDKQRYPRNYYWWSSSLRKGPLLQMGIRYKSSQYMITPYFEFSTNDLYLVSYWENRRSLSPAEILVLGAGIGVRLNPDRIPVCQKCQQP